ncbi:MAG: YqgE/AlgH family protein [Cytophagales bacterium]|nr:YqgE/AlgH family protein [Cytophagales bacterium]
MIDYKHNENLEPKKGDLLISEPFLPDPNFERTVIIICQHSEEGSFGFVLNKPSVMKFDEVMEDIVDFRETLYVGGPVQQDTLHFIHRAGDLIEGGVEISKNLYWGGNFETLKILIENKQINPNDFKFFLGYSGWGSGQLLDEIKTDSWIISPRATHEKIFDYKPEKLWRDILKEMGGRFRMFSNYPDDPRLN